MQAAAAAPSILLVLVEDTSGFPEVIPPKLVKAYAAYSQACYGVKLCDF